MVEEVSHRRSSRALIACFGLVFVGGTLLLPNPADASPNNFQYYDVSQPGATIARHNEGKTTYLIIGINPIAGQSVSVQLANSSTQQAPSFAGVKSVPQVQPKGEDTLAKPCRDVSDAVDKASSALARATARLSSANTPANAKAVSTAQSALAAVTASQTAQCAAVLEKLNVQKLQPTVASFASIQPAQLAASVSADVQSLLQGFGLSNAFADFLNSTDAQTAGLHYAKWVGSLDFSKALADAQSLDSSSLQTLVTQATVALSEVKTLTAKSTDPQVAAQITATSSLLASLGTPAVTALTQQADTLENQIAQIKAQPSLTYFLVNAPCVNQGFSADTWTVTFTRGNGQIDPPETIVCYAELSIGAMYYASSLNTDSYTLQSATVNGASVNVPVRVTNNRDQGSIAAVLNFCPGGGQTAVCGAVALSTAASGSGLSGLVGGGFLFAHRVIGVYGGARLGQVNVLSNGYTANITPVPNNGSYTHQTLGVGYFIGISLNLPSASSSH